MGTFKTRLFNALSTDRWNDSAVFFIRLFVGIMMLTHGIAKIQDFNLLNTTFPDPIGWGSQASLIAIILAEVVGSLFIIAGLLVRPAALVLAIGMLFATLTAGSELSIAYMGIYVMLMISGGAKYSLDRLIFKTK